MSETAIVEKPITVIGIGESGLDGLCPATRALVEGADVLAGGARHLALMPNPAGTTVDWTGGIDAGLERLEPHLREGLRIVVLASGDPMEFGVGRNVVARFGIDRVNILPAPGAISLTCAAMGWSRPDVTVVTLHGSGPGRSTDCLNPYLVPGVRLVILSQHAGTPGEVAAHLSNAGYGLSRLTVLERLGGPNERIASFTANAWPERAVDDLNTLAVELVADESARPLSRVPGLADDVYDHDGQLTKRAVRAVTLSTLAPLPGETLWDLGAGGGSIAIEWLRAHESLNAVAVERDPVRKARIQTNARRLGVPRLRVLESESMAALETLDGMPDAIFVGGGVSEPRLLETAFKRLRPGGRLVANAVTDASVIAMRAFLDKHANLHEVEMFTIGVEGKATITHFSVRKPQAGEKQAGQKQTDQNKESTS